MVDPNRKDKDEDGTLLAPAVQTVKTPPRTIPRVSQFESWTAVSIPQSLQTSTRWTLILFFLSLIGLAFIPWTQTVTATGQLSAYSPSERPQEVHAPIEARIKEWQVNEGITVKLGHPVVILSDVDPKFLAPDLISRLDQSIAALEERREAALTRAELLVQQIQEMNKLTDAASRSAESRVNEASKRIRSVEQRFAAAKVAAKTAALNLERSQLLEAEGLLSRRDLELAIQGDAAAQAELRASEAAVQEVAQSRSALTYGRTQIEAELAQRILDTRSKRASALAEAAKASKELADLALTRSNAVQRRAASQITAPIDGTVVRMTRVGPGEIVHPGDPLFTIVPTSDTRAVEMWVDSLHAPLLKPNRNVRLLFQGIPAIPLPSWPEMMAGTFDGRIHVVDQAPDRQNRFRFWVTPDPSGVPWPPQHQVRQGTQVMGWVLLNRVPLWYELWRRINLFPPDFKEDSLMLPQTVIPKAGRPKK